MTKSEALAALRLIIKPGDTVYTVLRYAGVKVKHVSAFVVVDGKIQDITYQVAQAIDASLDADGAIQATLTTDIVRGLGEALRPGGEPLNHVRL
ncbi:hypothetical protein [Nitrosovibrio sp. Nv4]|uniref:hypothetical protein n=1 Tax=Nitrosovibrio sp. Nv4 TaxID=1945880 RepID=UPI000BD9D4E6|nr:hypothetical protein [Nitrosovibrio sp. Nv4]SOD41337.1 hypothetical protein SAMN06298226_1632 [Nitrosovibrio sp. Nv4]